MCTYESNGKVSVGVEVGGKVYATDYTDMITLIKDGKAGLDRLREAAASARPAAVRRLRAPIPRPGKIFGSGVNYRSHGDEEPGYVFPDEPRIDFIKLSTAVIGPGDPIVIPQHNRVIKRSDGFHVDYEVEFGVVIGKHAKNVRREEALDYIFGYTVFNDVGARAVQFKNSQADLGKNFDTFAPMGPVIVTKDEIPDYNKAHITCQVNGELRQNAYVAEQIWSIPVVVEWISSIITMEPGDCIMTGTPAGCGTFRSPPLWLKPGDVVTCAEDTIGAFTNPVVSP